MYRKSDYRATTSENQHHLRRVRFLDLGGFARLPRTVKSAEEWGRLSANFKMKKLPSLKFYVRLMWVPLKASS